MIIPIVPNKTIATTTAAPIKAIIKCESISTDVSIVDCDGVDTTIVGIHSRSNEDSMTESALSC